MPATRSANKPVDGSLTLRRRIEHEGIDPMELSKRLFNLSKEQHSAYAINELNQHYTSVFRNQNRNNNPNPVQNITRERKKYKAALDCYIENNRSEGIHIVPLKANSLREVKEAIPFRGRFRVFIVRSPNQCEEVEDDNSSLPYQDRGDYYLIHCRVFKL